MQVKSIYKYARISAFKAREVTREIQGLPVAAALDIVAFSPKKAAALVEKTLKSAIANAENNNDLRAENLVVKEAVVGESATIKRFRPRARGSASPIRKRTSHIRIVLTDEVEIEKRDKTRKPASKKSRKPAAKPVKASEPLEAKAEVLTEPVAPATKE